MLFISYCNAVMKTRNAPLLQSIISIQKQCNTDNITELRSA